MRLSQLSGHCPAAAAVAAAAAAAATVPPSANVESRRCQLLIEAHLFDCCLGALLSVTPWRTSLESLCSAPPPFRYTIYHVMPLIINLVPFIDAIRQITFNSVSPI